MGDDNTRDRTAGDTQPPPLIDGDARVIGNFEVGPAGVGPMADVTSGDFYPTVPAAERPPEPSEADSSGS